MNAIQSHVYIFSINMIESSLFLSLFALPIGRSLVLLLKLIQPIDCYLDAIDDDSPIKRYWWQYLSTH